MLPAYYEFYNPTKILSGHHALEQIPYECAYRHVQRPLLMAGPNVTRYGLTALVQRACEGMTLCGPFTGISADAPLSAVQAAAERYRGEQCDGIIAVGGGSVMDAAKGVKMLIAQQGDDPRALMGSERLTLGVPVPLFAVPTTAGTGAEATAVAVLSDAHRKLEYVSPALMPDVAVLDVRMTAALPPYTTAISGMDALCHAIEAYTCTQKNPLSDAYAEAAVRLIAMHLVHAVEDGADETARFAMANAALLSGVSFSNSMVGLAHALAHAAGAVSGAPHGEMIGILLPYCMEYNHAGRNDLYGELLLPLVGPEEYAATPKHERAYAAIAAVRMLQRALHQACQMATRLRDTVVRREMLPEIACLALDDGALLHNPVDADAREMLHILEQAY